MANERRRVFLFLDNASTHRATDLYLHVTLQFLPPNTTAHLQPQNAGIIQAFKRQLDKVRKGYDVDKKDVMLEQVDELGKENVGSIIESIYNVDILVAMRWAQEAWKATIENCWSYTGAMDQDIFELVAGMDRMRIGSPTMHQLTV